MADKKEKSELEGRKYWKEKAERLQRENVELRNKLELTIRLCAAWEKVATENEKLLRDAEKKIEVLEEYKSMYEGLIVN